MSVTVTWPARVPLPSIQGYALKPKPNIDRSEMEVGPARQRRRSTQTTTDKTVQFEMTAVQQALFDAWYRHRALEGAAWFTIPYLSGLGLIDCEARFKGELTMTPRSGERWSVTGTLEVRDRPMLAAADIDLLADQDPFELMAALDAFHTALGPLLPALPYYWDWT